MFSKQITRKKSGAENIIVCGGEIEASCTQSFSGARLRWWRTGKGGLTGQAEVSDYRQINYLLEERNMEEKGKGW